SASPRNWPTSVVSRRPRRSSSAPSSRKRPCVPATSPRPRPICRTKGSASRPSSSGAPAADGTPARPRAARRVLGLDPVENENGRRLLHEVAGRLTLLTRIIHSRGQRMCLNESKPLGQQHLRTRLMLKAGGGLRGLDSLGATVLGSDQIPGGG